MDKLEQIESAVAAMLSTGDWSGVVVIAFNDEDPTFSNGSNPTNAHAAGLVSLDIEGYLTAEIH